MQLKKWLLTNIESVHKASIAVPISIIPATVCYFQFFQNRQPIVIYDLIALLFPLYVEIWACWQTGYSFQSEKEKYKEALSYYLATGRKMPKKKEAKGPIFNSKAAFYAAIVLCTAAIATAIYLNLYLPEQYNDLFGNLVVVNIVAGTSLFALLGIAIQKVLTRTKLYPPDQKSGLNNWKIPAIALLALALLIPLGKRAKSQFDEDNAKKQALITAMEKGTPYEFSNRKYRITEYRDVNMGEELTLKSEGGALLVVGGPAGLRYKAEDQDKQIIDAMEKKTTVYYKGSPYKIGKYNLPHYEITLESGTGYAIIVEQNQVDIGQPRPQNNTNQENQRYAL